MNEAVKSEEQLHSKPKISGLSDFPRCHWLLVRQAFYEVCKKLDGHFWDLFISSFFPI